MGSKRSRSNHPSMARVCPPDAGGCGEIVTITAGVDLFCRQVLVIYCPGCTRSAYRLRPAACTSCGHQEQTMDRNECWMQNETLIDGVLVLHTHCTKCKHQDWIPESGQLRHFPVEDEA